MLLRRIGSCKRLFQDLRINLLQQKFSAVSTLLSTKTNLQGLMTCCREIEGKFTINDDDLQKMKDCIPAGAAQIEVQDPESVRVLLSAFEKLTTFASGEWPLNNGRLDKIISVIETVLVKEDVNQPQHQP